ncbi:TolB family protein [Rubrivirga sp.]|uniref:TolB family protein n=1 Tax=Rubrivirga sp. TaxID=1885344 RepID=UPI003C776BB2
MRLALAAFSIVALSACSSTVDTLDAGLAQQTQEAVQASQADQPITGRPVDLEAEVYDAASDSLRFSGETRLRNIRQLTFGGNNAEAYWSFDGDDLIFQSDWEAINDRGCDQQFVMDARTGAGRDGSGAELVSTGLGRTTCGYFLADGRIIYSSTHEGDRQCPTTTASRTGQYVWDVFETFDIYVADADGSNTELLIGGAGYDAEPTVSPDGRFIVFTSTRSGDLELYRYEVATGETIQLTDELGYDGGAFFSPDSQQILWRASRPTGRDAVAYRALLRDYAVEPGALNLYVSDIDGSNARQITDLPGANWAPFFHPSGDKVLFSTNHHTLDQGGREFDLFLVDIDSGDLERVTFSGTFDAFPMFSPDGTQLVFASNRRGDRAPSRDTNVFVADWVETPSDVDLEFGL